MRATKRLLLIGIIGYLAGVCTPAHAESVAQWLVGLGPITFNTAGGAFLPLPVLQSLQQNSVSPVLQFVTATNLMNRCTADVIQNSTPDIRDPFVVATAKFTYGLCRIKKCYEQGMLILLLPQMQQDSQGSSSEIALFAQQFQNDPACDQQNGQGGSGGGGIDPNILALITQGSSNNANSGANTTGGD